MFGFIITRLMSSFNCERQIRAHVKTYFLAVSWDEGLWGEYIVVSGLIFFLPLFCHAMIDLLYSHIS